MSSHGKIFEQREKMRDGSGLLGVVDKLQGQFGGAIISDKAEKEYIDMLWGSE
jgi:hypothetical protein